jgi:hypothetical protein
MSTADGASPNNCAAVKHLVSPQTIHLAAAPLLDASLIRFELIGLPRAGWLIPMYAGHIEHFGFSRSAINPIAAVKVDRFGLHMTLTLPTKSQKTGVFTWCDERWPDIWKMGDEAQEYEAGDALYVWQKLSAAYVPQKRGCGERGVSRSSDATMKRNARDAFMAHVKVKNLETGAGVFGAAIDLVATEHLDLTRIVWPSRYASHTDDDVEADDHAGPHNIRTYIQRETKKAN